MDLKRAIRQILLLGTLLAAFPAQAVAASPDTIIRDCAQDGVVNGTYEDGDLAAARQQLAGDIAAYGDCYALFGAAMAANNPKASASNNNDDDTGGSPAEQRAHERKNAVDKAKRKQEARREIASIGDTLSPDDPAATDDGGSGDSSLPLILTLVALAGLATGGGLWYAARHNPAVANALRRVPLPRRRG
jgi:hypothetical protein